jgi:hypothetical protein
VVEKRRFSNVRGGRRRKKRKAGGQHGSADEDRERSEYQAVMVTAVAGRLKTHGPERSRWSSRKSTV